MPEQKEDQVVTDIANALRERLLEYTGGMMPHVTPPVSELVAKAKQPVAIELLKSIAVAAYLSGVRTTAAFLAQSDGGPASPNRVMCAVDVISSSLGLQFQRDESSTTEG